MPEPMACQIDGWADHPWKPWQVAGTVTEICATYFCYYLAERHPAPVQSEEG